MGSRSAFIVPLTAGNRARRDPNEGREASRGENQWRDTREGTMDPANLLTKRHWIVELARRKPGGVLFSLHDVIDFEWMREAYWLTRKDGATGIDGVTASDYEANLEANLKDLLERIKSGRYKAPPVRRAYIPKADGSQRPLGIPTFEDKVAQRAIAMVLEAVYEQDFLTCSYGFRPGRSAHQALQQLHGVISWQGQHWVLDVDIRKYFDTIPHQELRAILDRRVTDGVIRRMIDKWLKAGALEDGLLRHATEGSPQGGVISPCLSNIFLHHVLDNGLSSRCAHVSRGDVPLSASLTMPCWRSRTSSMPSGSLAFWVNALHGTDSHSIPTRRASSISATTDQMGLTIRRRMVPRSPSSASPTSGASRGQARMWCGR